MRTGLASFSEAPVRSSPGPHRRTVSNAGPRAGAGIAPVLCRAEFLCVNQGSSWLTVHKGSIISPGSKVVPKWGPKG